MWKILPLEEMRALKELELMDVPIVEELPVPSLEKLVLIQMRSLQICSGITASPVQVSTSQVDQNEWISSLRELTIHDCSSLVVSLPIPPSPLMSYSSIKRLSAFPTMEINNRKFTIESDELSELDGRILSFHNLKGVTSIYLRRCPNLTRISTEGFNQLITLECLVIQKCPNLFQLQISDQANNTSSATNIPALPSLKSLTISSCGIAGRWLTQMLHHVNSLEKLD